MPSSWSASLRFELQFTGENINLWGDKLNAALAHADYAVAGWLTKALSGDYALTTANAGDDEARAAMLKFTGAGAFTVTIPSVSKGYHDMERLFGAGDDHHRRWTTAAIQPGEVAAVICDDRTSSGSSQPTTARRRSPASPIQPHPRTWRPRPMPTRWRSPPTPSNLLGNLGQLLLLNGATALWRPIASADPLDNDNLLGRAVAAAVVL